MSAITAYQAGQSGLLRAFIRWNASLARRLDRLLLSERWRVSALGDFTERAVAQLLHPGMSIWDVGCGSRPLIDRETKKTLDLTITGLDVDPAELGLMEPGACDTTIVADLCQYRGEGTADLVICRTVLEHVPDVDCAFAGLVSMLRPGGTLAVCVPCRNALFARLNLMLPERARRKLLYGIWPHKNDGHSGFLARYDRCTPAHFLTLAAQHRLQVVEMNAYWWSTYFTFLLPLWALWRLWQIVCRPFAGDQVAEGFVLIATAERHGAGGSNAKR